MKATDFITMLAKTIATHGDRELTNGEFVLEGINFDTNGDTYELNLEVPYKAEYVALRNGEIVLKGTYEECLHEVGTYTINGWELIGDCGVIENEEI